MVRRARVGSMIPVEGVDPHTGSYLTYGIITGWIDSEGKKCSMKHAVRAIVELVKDAPGARKPWSWWDEENAWVQSAFDDEGPYSVENVAARMMSAPKGKL